MSREQPTCRQIAGDGVATELAAEHGSRPSRRGALLSLACVATLLAAFVAAPAPAQQGEEVEWVGTWTASPQPVWDADFFVPVGIPRSLRNQTLRQIARVSLGGDQLRIVISNEYGDRPLVIGAAHIALAGEGMLSQTAT